MFKKGNPWAKHLSGSDTTGKPGDFSGCPKQRQTRKLKPSGLGQPIGTLSLRAN